VPHASLDERLRFDHDLHRRRLHDSFAADRVRIVPTDLEPLIASADHLPDDADPVLAVSVGGSNTTVGLLSRRAGRFVVHHVERRPNPATLTPVEAYWDDLLLGQPALREYLSSHPAPVLSFAVAVLFDRGVPFHETKIETLDGLVARDLALHRQTHHLQRRTLAWLAARQLPAARVRGEGDAVMAHLGAVSLDTPDRPDDTMLLVCGTGMATSIHGQFVLCGMAENLDADDPLLHPLDQTERGQIQYRIAGKGLWGVMQRAAAQVVDPHVAAQWFRGPADSRRVIELAGHDPTQPPPHWLHADGPTLARLVEIAGRVVDRGVMTLLHCIEATDAHAARRPADRRLVYLTGSIAENPVVYRRLDARLADAGLADRFPTRRLDAADRPSPQADVTTLGAAVAGFAAR
jgi:hypothetical protein